MEEEKAEGGDPGLRSALQGGFRNGRGEGKWTGTSLVHSLTACGTQSRLVPLMQVCLCVCAVSAISETD